jgi:hypothetical protein
MLRIYVQEDKHNIYQTFEWENHTLNLTHKRGNFFQVKLMENLAAFWTLFLSL